MFAIFALIALSVGITVLAFTSDSIGEFLLFLLRFVSVVVLLVFLFLIAI